ncbi:MAG: hypothetical protein QNJ47_09415 [Nostocaceae cyanobacterium]|nr:hypothetical protein [Nostocaceae cyanobacterium]
MKGKAILSSIVLGLTFPLSSFASSPVQNSLAHTNPGQFDSSGTVVIAQRYLTSQDVSLRLKNNELRILNLLRKDSDKNDRDVRWDYITVEQINNQLIKLNVHGKIMKLGKPPIRVGIYIQHNSQGVFTVLNKYDYWTGKRCPAWCKRRVREALQEEIPNNYKDYEDVLNTIL